MLEDVRPRQKKPDTRSDSQEDLTEEDAQELHLTRIEGTNDAAEGSDRHVKKRKVKPEAPPVTVVIDDPQQVNAGAEAGARPSASHCRPQ